VTRGRRKRKEGSIQVPAESAEEKNKRVDIGFIHNQQHRNMTRGQGGEQGEGGGLGRQLTNSFPRGKELIKKGKWPKRERKAFRKGQKIRHPQGSGDGRSRRELKTRMGTLKRLIPGRRRFKMRGGSKKRKLLRRQRLIVKIHSPPPGQELGALRHLEGGSK